MNSLLIRKAFRQWVSALKSGLKKESLTAHQKRLERIQRLNPAGNYKQWLRFIHEQLKPATYLEIGVAKGGTLCLANENCLAVGVDPAFRIEAQFEAQTKAYRLPSDQFFADYDIQSVFNNKPIEFAFIDGLHSYRQVVRDFVHTIKYCRKDSLIAVHDVVPPDELCASVHRKTILWAGDVYKALVYLKSRSPGLEIKIVRAAPTGLALVSNLNAVDIEALEHGQCGDSDLNMDELSVSYYHEKWLTNLENIYELPKDPEKLRCLLN